MVQHQLPTQTLCQQPMNAALKASQSERQSFHSLNVAKITTIATQPVEKTKEIAILSFMDVWHAVVMQNMII